MAPHSSTLAWKIPWTEELGRLQSMGSLGVGHNWETSLALFTHALEKEMATHSSVLAWRIPGTGEPGGLPSRSLLQQIFLTQESNQGLLHCRQILYQLSYQGGPLHCEGFLDSFRKSGFTSTVLWEHHFIVLVQTSLHLLFLLVCKL